MISINIKRKPALECSQNAHYCLDMIKEFENK